MQIDLSGKTALVTASPAGIGHAIALGLAKAGAAVVLNGRRQDALDTAIAAIRALVPGSELRGVMADLETADGAQALIEAVPAVDILVNNAGINGPVVESWNYPVEAWDQVLAIDLTGVFYCCRTAIPHMRERKYGRIVNVASMAGKDGVQYISAYSAAKAGLIAFTKSAAKELAQDGVLLNCIAPAMVETGLMAEMTPEHIAASKAKIPMGRFLQIEEIANMVTWIAGPECSFTTGFVFDLSGGRATY